MRTRKAGAAREAKSRVPHTTNSNWRGYHVVSERFRFNLLTSLPVFTRRCPKCGELMTLNGIGLSTDVDHEERNYECASCAYCETVRAKFR
jgi:hypothetical protein